MAQQLVVRNFIKKYSKLSRVTVDRDNYDAMSKSGRALASRGRIPCELQPAGSVKLGNQYLNKYVIDGHTVYYGFDKNASKEENPHIFMMDTAEAESIYQPMGETLDIGDELDMSNITENNSLELGEEVKP